LTYAKRFAFAVFKCRTKGVIINNASFGMDMDLPEDYEGLKANARERKGIEKG